MTDSSICNPVPTFQIIGVVETEVADAEVAQRRRDVVSTIVIQPTLEPALLGIDEYSHLIVLFWMSQAPPCTVLQAHPRGDPNLPARGVLAQRGRNRPNPIGLAVVELLARDGNRLMVRRLDAFHGTPVLDIKPYDDYDVVQAPRTADWFRARQRQGPSSPTR